jgi:hypothetical protein
MVAVQHYFFLFQFIFYFNSLKQFMRRTKSPFAGEKHDLSGYAAINFNEENNFNSFASAIPGFNPSRHKLVALRMFVQDGEPVFTVYATDLLSEGKSGIPKDKIPVKKFKIELSFEEFMKRIKSFDFTVTDGKVDITDIQVVNK